jgi:hypothetical protein
VSRVHHIPVPRHSPAGGPAAEAVSALRDGWQRLRGASEGADDDQLEVTTAGYTYAAEPPRGGRCVVGPPLFGVPFRPRQVLANEANAGGHGTSSVRWAGLVCRAGALLDKRAPQS